MIAPASIPIATANSVKGHLPRPLLLLPFLYCSAALVAVVWRDGWLACSLALAVGCCLLLLLRAAHFATRQDTNTQRDRLESVTMSAFPVLKLQYFDHEGIAEAIRLAFFMGGVPFQDERLSEAQFSELKPTLPFGQVPVLDVGNGALVIAQSQALLRYAGRLANLFPVNNPVAALKVDEILNVLDELRIRVDASRVEDDPGAKKQMREELAQEVIPRYLGMLDPRLEQLRRFPGCQSSGESKLPKVFVHDIVIFLMLKHFRMGVFDYIPSNIADTFGALCASFDAVDAHPKVKEWYALQHGRGDPQKPNEGEGEKQKPALTLTYVDQAGRAEPIRLALFIGGVDFEDERISPEEFAVRKGLLPYHQLPVLEVGGDFLAETFAILRYAGTIGSGGLYPAHDPLRAARVDEILSALDAHDNLYTQPLMRETDPQIQAEMMRRLTENSIPTLLRFLDARVAAAGAKFACGDALSVADLAIFTLVAFMRDPSASGLPAAITEPFKHLARVHDRVKQHPKVVEWYAARAP